MKIALFGGSFNPVHKEHVNIVKAAVEAYGLDRVVIIPSFITPNKAARAVSPSARLEMCRLAFGGVGCAEVSDYEISKSDVSYSYITCRHFREVYPDDELYFILGADMLENFPRWKNPREILECVNLLVCARGNGESLIAACKTFKNAFGFNPATFGYVGGKVSSTRVRVLASLGESVGEFTGEKTANYISRNKIYLLPRLHEVKNYLTPSRWRHTLRVAEMAAENCARLKIDEVTAVTAAALHDCAKYSGADAAELKGFVCPKNVPDTVIHQYAGAHVAERVFGITDKEITEAIACHASGRKNMSPLDKLIYLCDMLEGGRDFDGVEELRKIFARDIDECLCAALKHQIDYLEASGAEIYPLTKEAYEFIKGKNNGQ